MVTTAFIILLLCGAANHLLLSRSVTALNVDQKARLFDLSAGKRPWFFFALAAVVPVWAIATTHFGHRNWWFAGLFVAFLLLGVPFLISRLRGLSRLDLPHAYVRSAWLGGLLVTGAMTLMLAVMAYETMTLVHR